MSEPQSDRLGRVYVIDGLRGLMALAVMMYHLSYWTHLVLPEVVRGLLMKAGIYAVCGFFVISGYSLYWVYSERSAKGWIFEYCRRRFLRIAPLFWLSMLLTLWTLREHPTLGVPPGYDVTGALLLNATLMFGFVSPGAVSYVTGGWSIGVEVVFYMLFPLLLLWSANNMPRLVIAAALALCASWVWSWLAIEPNVALAEQWGFFVTPIYYGVYFIGGVCLAALAKARRLLPYVAMAGCLLSAVLFTFIQPMPADQVHIVQGLPFIGLMLATIGLVGFASHIRVESVAIKQLCEYMGNSSYALYLLHPIVFHFIVNRVNVPWLQIGLTVGLSILLALLVYRYFELRIMQWGRARGLREAGRV